MTATAARNKYAQITKFDDSSIPIMYYQGGESDVCCGWKSKQTNTQDKCF